MRTISRIKINLVLIKSLLIQRIKSDHIPYSHTALCDSVTRGPKLFSINSLGPLATESLCIKSHSKHSSCSSVPCTVRMQSPTATVLLRYLLTRTRLLMRQESHIHVHMLGMCSDNTSGFQLLTLLRRCV